MHEDLIGRLKFALEKQKAGAFSYLFWEAIEALSAQPDAGSVGDARAQFEAWADGEGLVLNRHGNGRYGYERAATATAWGAWQAALAARQPVGEPVAWQWKLRTDENDEWVTRHKPLPASIINDPACEYRVLYAAPTAPAAVPVDGIDWKRLANEWADCACNGLQWLKNVRDGMAFEGFGNGIPEMTKNIERIRGLYDAMRADRSQPAAAKGGDA